MADDTRTPVTLCWHCDRALDAASGFDATEGLTPEPGAVSLCLYCGAVAIFGGDLRLEPATEEQLDEMVSDVDFRRVFFEFQWARQKVMLRSHLLGFEAEHGAEARVDPPEGSEPEGPGWLKPWAPQPGVTFLAFGAVIRSLLAVEPPPPRGVVGVDVKGKWNHGAEDTLSLIVSPDVAEEWGADMREAARAARRDEARVRRGE